MEALREEVDDDEEEEEEGRGMTISPTSVGNGTIAHEGLTTELAHEEEITAKEAFEPAAAAEAEAQRAEEGDELETVVWADGLCLLEALLEEWRVENDIEGTLFFRVQVVAAW